MLKRWERSALKLLLKRKSKPPGREIAEYRHRLNRKRRQLIRSVMSDLIAGVDETLRSLNKIIPQKPKFARQVKSSAWNELKDQIQEIETLLGSGSPRPSRWTDMRRHLHFSAMQDLMDIMRLDWPEVEAGLTKGLFDHNEPISVIVADLARRMPKERACGNLILPLSIIVCIMLHSWSMDEE